MKNQKENLFTSGFDIEGQDNNNNNIVNENNISDDDCPFLPDPPKEEVKINSKSVESISVSSELAKEISADTFVYDEFEKQVSELYKLSKKIAVIDNDFDNQSARDLAKQLTSIKTKVDNLRKEWNTPHQTKIDNNNDKAKTIVQPLEKEVERLKQSVTFYESEKERKRLEEKKKLEAELKEKEEKEKKESERKIKIRSEIDRLRSDGQSKVNECKNTKEVNDLEVKLKGWKLKPEFFMEFIDEVEKVKSDIIESLSKRKPLIIELEEKKAEAEKLQGEQREQAEKETKAKQDLIDAENARISEENKNKKLQEENDELSAKQDLLIMIASFGIKYNVEDYLNSIIKKYGNCRQAISERDKVVEDYKQSLYDKSRMNTIESEKVKNVRLTFEFNIVDESLIPREFLSIDEVKIRKALVDNRKDLEADINGFKIDGLIIYPKKSTIAK